MLFKIEIYNAIWLFVVIFMLHDFEEIIAVENWAGRTEVKVKKLNSKIGFKIYRFWNVGSYSFAKRDVFIFLTMSIITFLKVQYNELAWTGVLYLSFMFFVLIHNLVHILQTLVLRTYTPGLYSAVLLLSPYAICLLLRLT